jgi:hypothetical protein
MPISGLLAYDQKVADRICLTGPGDVQIKALLLHDGCRRRTRNAVFLRIQAPSKMPVARPGPQGRMKTGKDPSRHGPTNLKPGKTNPH